MDLNERVPAVRDARRDSYIEFKLRCLCFSVVLTDGLTHHEEGGRCRDEDRRQRTEDNTEDHGEGEAADAVTTEDEDTQQHNQRGHGGVDGTCQGLVQRGIEQALTVTFRIQVEVLTDTVEDHHLIIDRVTYYGQDSTVRCRSR